MRAVFARFLDAFPPDGELRRVAVGAALELNRHAHPLLLELWRTVGCGSFADGFLEIVAPGDFGDMLGRWLGCDAAPPDRIPFARTAFGDLIYFRDLRAKVRSIDPLAPIGMEDMSDVSFLSVHYRRSEIVSYRLADFLGADAAVFLRKSKLAMYPLYRKLRETMPRPAAGACYFFTPALVLGGTADADHIGSGDCRMHLEVLRGLGPKLPIPRL